MVRLLLDRPVVFFALITLGLGALGAAGLLGSRYGPQLIPGGMVGFAYGLTIGGFVAGVFFLLRRSSNRDWLPKLVGLVGAALILGLFLLLAR